jgi:hypothetical protein
VADFIATVNEDGESYTAEVTHFSSYSGGGEGAVGDLSSTFDIRMTAGGIWEPQKIDSNRRFC